MNRLAPYAAWVPLTVASDSNFVCDMFCKTTFGALVELTTRYNGLCIPRVPLTRLSLSVELNYFLRTLLKHFWQAQKYFVDPT